MIRKIKPICLLIVVAVATLLFGLTKASTVFDNVSSDPILSVKRFDKILTTYDKKTRPNFGGPAVEVRVQVGLVAIGPINEKDSTFGIDIYFRQTWMDERLAFGGNYSITINADPQNLLWTPDTSYPNSVASKKHYVTTINSRIRISPNGFVYTSQRVSMQCTCHMDLRFFPLDTQVCSLAIESYSFTQNEIYYMWMDHLPPVVGDKKNFLIDGYHIDNISTTRQEAPYNLEVFSWLVLSFTISRNFNYYLYHFYCPSGILVVMTWATFWMPCKAFPARVALIVTTLLSSIFIAQSGISQLVRTSYRTSLEIFFTLNIVYIVLSMVEYLFVINVPPRKYKSLLHMVRGCCREKKCCIKVKSDRMDFKDDSRTEESPDQIKFRHDKVDLSQSDQPKLTGESSSDPSTSLNSDSHFIDYWCRFFFPGSYVLCLLYYFNQYTQAFT